MWTTARRFSSIVSSISPSVVLNSLKERGLVNKNTNIPASIPADCHHDDRPSVYVGFDPTADSLHTGNLVTIIALLHFQRAGYQPLAVIGGATGVIGDPSGRTKERDVLPENQLHNNIIGISNTLSRISQNAANVTNTGDHVISGLPLLPLKILNNADWYNGMSVIDFMGTVGRHFRLSSMLQKESVNQRLNSHEGMSFTEFSYQIFQSYDFLCLSKSHNCWLQIGGGDQWGNITAGCRYVHKCSDKQVHGLTVPLITDSLGQKLGKSAGNAVWLSPDKTTPYHLYQYFFNTTDDDVERFLKYFTFIPIKDIDGICTEHKMNPEHRIAQRHLAENVTRLIHGEDGLTQSQNATAALFGDPTMLMKMSASDIEKLFKDTAPSCAVSKDVFASNPTIIDLAVTAGAVQSKKHARRLIQSGGLYINNVRVESSDDYVSHDSHVIDDCITIIRTGKKSHHLIKWT